MSEHSSKGLLEGLVSRWQRLWFPSEASLVRLGVFRFVTFGLALTCSGYLVQRVLSYARAGGGEGSVGIWNPIYLFDLLGVQPPSQALAEAAAPWHYILVACATFGFLSRVTMPLAALSCLLWWGMGYSFGQPHHERIALTFALLALALSPAGARCSVDALIARWRGRTLPVHSPFAHWPILLTALAVTLGYTAAGWTKLARCGFEWANGYTMQAQMMGVRGAWTAFMAEHLVMTQIMSSLLLATQALFFIILLIRPFRWVLVPAVTAFHLGAWLTLESGAYITLWGTAIVSFFGLEKLPQGLARSFRRSRILGLLASLALLAFGAIVDFVFQRTLHTLPLAGLRVVLWGSVLFTLITAVRAARRSSAAG